MTGQATFLLGWPKYVVTYREGHTQRGILQDVGPDRWRFIAERAGCVVDLQVASDPGAILERLHLPCTYNVVPGDSVTFVHVFGVSNCPRGLAVSPPEAKQGAVCTRCGARNEYAEPNAKYVCYECRP